MKRFSSSLLFYIIFIKLSLLQTSSVTNEKFFYFAYGSNLLTSRIHINSPTAVKVDVGKLESYRLDFVTYSTRWKGAAATIVPQEKQTVYGIIWQIDMENLPFLDKQEGVDINLYKPINVDVQLLNNRTIIKCRTYVQTKIPEYVENISELPKKRQPSKLYMDTIIKGAEENKIPEKYIEFMKTIPHNDYWGENSELRLKLNITTEKFL